MGLEMLVKHAVEIALSAINKNKKIVDGLSNYRNITGC